MNTTPLQSRRDFLWNLGGGFAGLAFSQLFSREALAAGMMHHTPKVKRVIQLFMTGGASPMDTFDYKPALEKLHGQMLGPKDKPEGQTAMPGAMMKSPFQFAQHGQSGRWVSSVFPEQAKLVDEMAFLMAMQSKTNIHGPGTYMMNSGFLLPGFPCMGAWISYALGNLADNLPTFVVLPDPRGLPYNQRGCFSSGFLPAAHQGMVINAASPRPVPDPFADERYGFATREADRAGLSLLDKINRAHAAEHRRFAARRAIASYELAAKMQLSAPEAFDVMREPESCARLTASTKSHRTLAPLPARPRSSNAACASCRSGAARRAGEQLGQSRQHQTELPPMAASVDQPIAALLRDLKSRGLAEDTLVIWTTEFGRTPFAQGSLGRDHNGGSFVTWLWGAGIKPGSPTARATTGATRRRRQNLLLRPSRDHSPPSRHRSHEAHRPAKRHRPAAHGCSRPGHHEHPHLSRRGACRCICEDR